MANSFFHFKQFTILQQHSAMKVCTDACLFGAWLAEEIKHYRVKTCLDIGTGTGLLPLIIRQKNDISFDCVELDETAAEEAQHNFKASPWPNTFAIYNTSIQQFNTNKKYDFVLSNPPFFENNLKSIHPKRNAALHDTTLSLHELLFYAKHFLNEEGIAAVMLPYQKADTFIVDVASHNLFCTKRIDIQQTISHPYFRSLLLLATHKSDLIKSSIAIKDAHDKYTDTFKSYLKDYYLYL